MGGGDGIGGMRERDGIGGMRERDGIGGMRERDGIGGTGEGDGIGGMMGWQDDEVGLGQGALVRCQPATGGPGGGGPVLVTGESRRTRPIAYLIDRDCSKT